MRRLIAGFLGVIFVFTGAMADADEGKVPNAARGTWGKGGGCRGETLTITVDTLQYKGRKPNAVYFTPKESPRGYGAIHYVKEGNVDNFEYADDKGQLLYNPEGFGIGAPVLYKRCHP
jgi:hypothetical protein